MKLYFLLFLLSLSLVHASNISSTNHRQPVIRPEPPVYPVGWVIVMLVILPAVPPMIIL
jgi:hypothetical protein